MSQDRELIDTIKPNFARKSSAQLQEIVQAPHKDRWSPEAVAAAAEVLQDRLAGRAEEPQVPEEEEEPPPVHYEPGEVALGVLGALLTGYLVIPYYRRVEKDPDQPMPFGPRMAWLALDTADTEAAATALGLEGTRNVIWAEGIEAAHQASVFVTPPLGDWTLAVSTALFPPDRAEAFVKPLLERLSRQFGDAQYFCTHRDVELCVWARARNGRLVRGYGWLGQRSLTLWDEGGQTKEERDLGLQPFEGRASVIERAPDTNVATGTTRPGDRISAPAAAGQDEDWDAVFPDEASVMQLASLWSIDPTTLDEQFKEPETGLLGKIAWAGSRTGR